MADVIGDWREEVVVLAGKRLRVYANPDPNHRPDEALLWSRPHYRRLKQTGNYYRT